MPSRMPSLPSIEEDSRQAASSRSLKELDRHLSTE